MSRSHLIEPPRRRPLIAAGAVLLLLAAVAVAGAGGVDAQDAPSGSAEDGASTTVSAAAGVANVELSELMNLGLLLMERRPEAIGATTVPPPVDVPWTDDYRTGPAADSPVVVPPPALGPGDGTIFAVGDSVLQGVDPFLGQAVGGWDLRTDAEVGRTFPGGIDALFRNRASVGQVMVIILGHNYGGGGRAQAYLDEIMSVARTSQRVVLVTVTEWSPAQAEVNRAIYATAQRYPNVVVAPWAETVRANPEFLWDHVHPNRSGSVALANLIATMIGPAPELNGTKPPPPVIRPIPVDPGPVNTTTSTARVGTSTTAASSTSTTGPTSTTTAPSTTTPTSITTTTAPGDATG
ncbi:MAG: hypothetical protein R2690_14875 [Acidimicrobiales bacterium]